VPSPSRSIHVSQTKGGPDDICTFGNFTRFVIDMSGCRSHGETGCESGVYLVDVTQRDELLRRQASTAAASFVVLDGQVISGRDSFFLEIARAMAFPDYFGHNWDAVYDCLTDPSVMPADGVVIVVDGFDHFARAEPEQWSIGLRVFRDACAFWQPLATPLHVLINGLGYHAPGTPALHLDCLMAGSGDA
jgi:RNAse (barnase) inhibitor barstar